MKGSDVIVYANNGTNSHDYDGGSGDELEIILSTYSPQDAATLALNLSAANFILAPTIMIGTIGTNNIISATDASNGFTISGTAFENGADTTAVNGQTVTVVIDNSSGTPVETYTTTVQSNGDWWVNVSSTEATALTDGSYTVTANVSDVAGNAATPATQTVTVDEHAPTITMAKIDGNNIINKTDASQGVTINGTASDPDGSFATVSGQTVTVVIDTSSGTAVDTYTTTVHSNGDWSVNVNSTDAKALTDGSYTVTANVSDVAGNAATPATQPVTVDETPPTLTISGINPDTGSSSTDGITDTAKVTVSSTIDAADHNLTVKDGSKVVGTTTADNNGNWSLANVTLNTGTNDLTATAIDVAGNTGTSNTFVATLDTTPPKVAETSYASNTHTLSGTNSDVGSGVATVYVSDTTHSNSGYATLNGGSWTYQNIAMTDGDHLTIVATDVAGNQTTINATAQTEFGPGGIAGSAINLAMTDPSGANAPTTVTISGMPDGLEPQQWRQPRQRHLVGGGGRPERADGPDRRHLYRSNAARRNRDLD